MNFKITLQLINDIPSYNHHIIVGYQFSICSIDASLCPVDGGSRESRTTNTWSAAGWSPILGRGKAGSTIDYSTSGEGVGDTLERGGYATSSHTTVPLVTPYLPFSIGVALQ